MQTSFLQSYEWEQLQEMLGRKNWRINGHLVIQHDLPNGYNYLYAPHLENIDDDFLHKINEIADEEKSIFLKVDPVADTKYWKIDIMGWQFSHEIQPRRTNVINLAKPEEEILNEMHYKTRYNIHVAEKHGVGVFICDRHHAHDHFDFFWELLSETAVRDVFNLHPKHYYEKLLSIHGEKFSNKLVFAEHRGRILAGAIVNYFNDNVVYLHGASSNLERSIMAPYALHWRIITDAKKNGFKSYDLWGIDEEKWPGVTRFKLGFGGNIVEYPRSIDIIFRPMWYKAYRILRRLT